MLPMSKSKRAETEILRDVREAIARVKTYAAGIEYAEFLEDIKTQDAVVRNLEIIGEAVKNISTDFRKKHKGVEWKNIAGFRDRMIHHYFGINWEIVWDVIKNKLPELDDQVEKILKTFDTKKKHKN